MITVDFFTVGKKRGASRYVLKLANSLYSLLLPVKPPFSWFRKQL